MRKKLIVLWCVCCLPILGFGQIITIKDSETGAPLSDVSLISNYPNIIEVTNVKGQVDLKHFKGVDYIQIIRTGYKKLRKSYSELANLEAELELEPFVFSGDIVVVSATKWARNMGEIPLRTVHIDQADLALQNPQTAADLLAVSGEVFVQKSQLGGGSPMIRGFATNRLLYSVDGVRMNTAIFRGGNIQNVISMDPFSIENTEVLFGPGSVIYGSDAIGAVMSFKTLTPEFSLSDTPLISGNAVARYSSASNEQTMHFDLNVGFKKIALLTSFSSHNFGDLKMGSNGPDEYLRPFYVGRIDSTDVIIDNSDPEIQRPSGYSQINLMQKVRYSLNENLDIEYAFHFSETSAYSRYDRHIRYKDGLPRYGQWSYGPQKWLMNYLSIVHSKPNALYDQLNLRLAQQEFEESRISRDFNDPIKEIRTESVYAYSANLDFVKSISRRHTVNYGLEVVFNDIISQGVNEDISTGKTTSGASRYPQSTWASYGVYLAEQFKINEKLIFNVGARYNQYQLSATFSDEFYPFPFSEANLKNGAVTGNLGTVYRPNEKWAISVNASTGFRSPNVDDIGKVFDSEPGSVVVPNPNLEAEYAYNGEIGLTRLFYNRVKFNLTGYYTLLKNAIVRRDFTLNGADSLDYDGELSRVQALQNAAEARVFGLQTGVEVDFGSGFRLTAHFNYQNGIEELDDGTTSPSRHAAPWFGVTRLSYTYKQCRIEINSQYSGEKSFDDLPESEKGKDYIYALDENGDPYSPAWYTLNLKASYQFNDHFMVSSGLENIMDQRYRPYSSGIVAPGRNLILSLKATF